MANVDGGASNPMSYYTAPPNEPLADESRDLGNNSWSWEASDWSWGDHWARQGWHRPYGYRNHWSWGSKAEWESGTILFSLFMVHTMKVMMIGVQVHELTNILRMMR